MFSLNIESPPVCPCSSYGLVLQCPRPRNSHPQTLRHTPDNIFFTFLTITVTSQPQSSIQRIFILHSAQKMNLIKLLFQKYFSLKGEVLFGRNNVFYKNIQLQNITPAPLSLKSRYYNGLTDSGAKPNFDPTIHFQTIIHIVFLSNFGEF